MCGIIAVVRRPSGRTPPLASQLLGPLETARAALEAATETNGAALERAAAAAEEVDSLLRGTAGVRALLGSPGLIEDVDQVAARLDGEIGRLERAIDETTTGIDTPDLERVNAAMVRLKDACWAVRRDRLRTARAVADLAGDDAGDAAVEAYTSVQTALSALDRLEVRGRDSAGLQVLVDGHGLDLHDPEMEAELARRAGDPRLTSLSVRAPNGHLSFVYKAAAEIGELGDNGAALRRAIGADGLLRRALASSTARATVVCHTRWASVGIISEANAHPLDSVEEGAVTVLEGDEPYVTAALNGDVDNHADLRSTYGLRIPPEVTTDAKVIPAIVARHLAEGFAAEESFLRTVGSFEGSVAVAASVAREPARLFLALRGSGQALYVGLAEDAFIVASEPYGLVEETPRYLRMDGETPSGPAGQPGQVVVLDRDGAGSVDGIRRLNYAADPLPVAEDELASAEITTRDIDRGAYPHFLLKELSEAPSSFRKTLRGKLSEGPNGLTVALGDETLPPSIRARLRNRSIRWVRVIGQGTAAVAGQAVAAVMADALEGSGTVVDALPATELSGFGLRDEMDDTLVVAISQSGTTTDTNRTVDLARARGAAVIAIVNRRNSDLVEKSHGVLYTSDGRDVEMSVPSTKAFYAQVAAGVLLATAMGEAAGCAERSSTAALLAGLRALPDAMQTVLGRRAPVAEAAGSLAPTRRHWAIVGNGRNRIAASEIRIKLSELCYLSIACDATEDKKHIDLAAEPLILVCATGLSGANADDVAKEVAIYRAHRAAPVVIATEGEGRFAAAMAVLTVPEIHPSLAFVLSAMVGHLFGYEAALAIDAQALPLREARGAVESVVSEGGGTALLERLGAQLAEPAAAFAHGMRGGFYDGHLDASVAVEVASLLRYALGVLPLEAYVLDYGSVGTPSVVVEHLTRALTRAIDELTRPIDAIKHQAKTVTVGISRSEDALLTSALVQGTLAAGAGRDRLSYKTLRTLAALDPAVAEITGYTHYRIDGAVTDGTATISVLDKGGVATAFASRAESDATLRGTKRRAASQREVTVARGRHDGRMVLLVPETKDASVVGLALLHVRFEDHLEPAAARLALEGYQGRYAALRDAVTETEPTFRDEVLAEVDPADLFTVPVHVLADRWRS